VLFSFFFTLGKQGQNPVVVVPTPTLIPNATPQISIVTTRHGAIKATYQIQYLLDKTSIATPDPSSTPSPTVVQPTQIPSRYVLLEKNDKLTFLLVPSSLSLNKYVNLNVIATGEYDSDKSTLKIIKSEDIEILQ